MAGGFSNNKKAHIYVTFSVHIHTYDEKYVYDDITKVYKVLLWTGVLPS